MGPRTRDQGTHPGRVSRSRVRHRHPSNSAVGENGVGAPDTALGGKRFDREKNIYQDIGSSSSDRHCGVSCMDALTHVLYIRMLQMSSVFELGVPWAGVASSASQCPPRLALWECVGKGWASGKQRCRHHDGGYMQRVSIRPAGRMQQRKGVQTRATKWSTHMPTKSKQAVI